MGKRAYLFDMDGVLVDNCRYHVLSWLEFAKRRGGRLTEAQVVEWMGAPGRDYIVRMFDEPMPPDRVEALLAEKEAIYRELYRPALQTRKGLLGFLEGAKKANVPCAVVTGGPTENVDFVLDGLRFSMLLLTSSSIFSLTPFGFLRLNPSRFRSPRFGSRFF